MMKPGKGRAQVPGTTACPTTDIQLRICLALLVSNGNLSGQMDEREKATIVLDLAMLTPEEWNDSDLEKFDNRYLRQAVEAKKWAFVSDYVRLYALLTEGGVYFDTVVFGIIYREFAANALAKLTSLAAAAFKTS